ncbi:MAG: YegS/Rv2252/BmrU family lipid kinase [Lachnospiraceae bacterium]|nr:YegS/Rv2252/BmrU family lipid kinase [Lachnospiraceae bacterium]MBQ9464930.1 YegS/Rv2252/BmrU family lipid kinase [Lachnospiraceae bacterium]
MKKVLLIVNPKAHGGLLPQLAEILNIFSQADYRTEVYITQAAGDAALQVPVRALGKDIVVSCGGDGTMNEIVTGLMNMKPEDRPALGLIPAGTTNDLAKSHNIVGTMLDAAKLVVEDRENWVDIGCINGKKYFEYVAGFGAFTGTSYLVPSGAKSILGYTAYLVSGAVELLNLTSKSVRITTEEESWDDQIMSALITNASQVAGFRDKVAYNVDTNDGQFELLLIREPKDLVDMDQVLGSLVFVSDNKFVRRIKTSKVKFEFELPAAWVKDGEYAGDYTETVVENIHSAIRIIGGPPVHEVDWVTNAANIYTGLGQNPMPIV